METTAGVETIPNILCLGVSYPSLQLTFERLGRCDDTKEEDRGTLLNVSIQSKQPRRKQPLRERLEPDEGSTERLEANNLGIVSPSTTTTKGTRTLTVNHSVQSVLDCVKSNYMTAMDGRDLARCLATEQHCSVRVYTVSQEEGAVYEPNRHLWANFNRPSFVHALQKKFAGVQFRQVILDYFWIPAGWDVSHWRSTLFQQTLVYLAERNVIQQPKKEQRCKTIHNKAWPKNCRTKRPRNLSADTVSDKIKIGVVYLPFCLHCFKEVIAHSETLVQHYDISFLRKGSLDENTLWAGTQQIDSVSMRKSFSCIKRLSYLSVYRLCIVFSRLKFILLQYRRGARETP